MPLAVAVSSFLPYRPHPDHPPSKSLLGHCTLVLGADEFALHQVKLVRHPDPARPPDGSKVGVFFPAHTDWVHCPGCNHRAEQRDNYCSACGRHLGAVPTRDRRHHDWAHPLTRELRDRITRLVVDAWRASAPAARPPDRG